uniref:Zinc finger protein 277 n=1 Tax=Phallusia mammillata TaxID=59560 RepID=A0A6F9DWX7_9ASCI|nr:zinc finger protein 277 [Phallusia mammillata]
MEMENKELDNENTKPEEVGGCDNVEPLQSTNASEVGLIKTVKKEQSADSGAETVDIGQSRSTEDTDVNDNLVSYSSSMSKSNDNTKAENVAVPNAESKNYVYDESHNDHKSSHSMILEPLLLKEEKLTPNSVEASNKKLADNETPCMLCQYTEKDLDSKAHYDEYLCHLIVEHKMVVADVKLIADLRKYAIYWKKRFQEGPLDEFCSKIKTNTGRKDMGESEEYFLLCDALPEDKKIREELQLSKLKQLLLRQEFERKDNNFERMCPFCTKHFKGNRINLFNHMTEDHNFNIGHPDNIVNVREFLDEIHAKLDALQCLFCEKLFKDRASLREHMRKKAHRRLNPKNKDYDKYYIINYLELGKNWETLQNESERLDSNEDWSGWNEESQNSVCFFCESSFDQAENVYNHMKDEHDFDFVSIRRDMQMSFYQQVKMINFIRRLVHIELSMLKTEPSEVAKNVSGNIKSSTQWNQPQYYFPTYENDSLLCQLEDKDGLFEPEDTFVIGEDGMDCRAIVNDSVLTDLVVTGYFEVP